MLLGTLRKHIAHLPDTVDVMVSDDQAGEMDIRNIVFFKKEGTLWLCLPPYDEEFDEDDTGGGDDDEGEPPVEYELCVAEACALPEKPQFDEQIAEQV